MVVNDFLSAPDAPIPGWRTAPDGVSATLRWHRSIPIAWLIVAMWNGGFWLFLEPKKQLDRTVLPIVVIGAMVMGIRALLARTRIDFAGGQLKIGNWLAPWVRYRIDHGNIAGFQIRTSNQGPRIVALLTSGAFQELPLDWQPVGIKASWREKLVWTGSDEDASRIASALGAMLHRARREGHDTYRS